MINNILKIDPGEFVYVLNFVLRDTEIDTINVGCWGSRAFVDDLNEKISIFSSPSINLMKRIELNLHFEIIKKI